MRREPAGSAALLDMTWHVSAVLDHRTRSLGKGSYGLRLLIHNPTSASVPIQCHAKFPNCVKSNTIVVRSTPYVVHTEPQRPVRAEDRPNGARVVTGSNFPERASGRTGRRRAGVVGQFVFKIQPIGPIVNPASHKYN